MPVNYFKKSDFPAHIKKAEEENLLRLKNHSKTIRLFLKLFVIE